jgi:hypothetical protein
VCPFHPSACFFTHFSGRELTCAGACPRLPPAFPPPFPLLLAASTTAVPFRPDHGCKPATSLYTFDIRPPCSFSIDGPRIPVRCALFPCLSLAHAKPQSGTTASSSAAIMRVTLFLYRGHVQRHRLANALAISGGLGGGGSTCVSYHITAFISVTQNSHIRLHTQRWWQASFEARTSLIRTGHQTQVKTSSPHLQPSAIFSLY